VKLTSPPPAAPATPAARLSITISGAQLPEGCIVPPAASTAAAASTIPAPHSAVVQSLVVPAGNARADVESFDVTWDGVNAGLTESINETMPATCGAAMLVPW